MFQHTKASKSQPKIALQEVNASLLSGGSGDSLLLFQTSRLTGKGVDGGLCEPLTAANLIVTWLARSKVPVLRLPSSRRGFDARKPSPKPRRRAFLTRQTHVCIANCPMRVSGAGRHGGGGRLSLSIIVDTASASFSCCKSLKAFPSSHRFSTCWFCTRTQWSQNCRLTARRDIDCPRRCSPACKTSTPCLASQART